MRIADCRDCGQPFQGADRGYLPARCPDCTNAHRVQARAVRRADNNAGTDEQRLLIYLGSQVATYRLAIETAIAQLALGRTEQAHQTLIESRPTRRPT